MTVTYKQFISDKGFKSPGFSVDEFGNFSVASLDATGSLKINGSTVLTSTTLASSVINSSLTSVGILKALTVESMSDVNLTSATSISLAAPAIDITAASLGINTSGTIVLAPGTTGSINNMSIGLVTPKEAQFTTVIATENVFVGNQNIKALATALAVALS